MTRLQGACIAIAFSLAAQTAAADMPTPVLQFEGTETYQVRDRAMVLYKLSVANRSGFAQELFSPAPDLVPCGTNINASRTWVDIIDGEGGTRLYSFCALKSAEELGKLSFALPKDKPAPRTVLVTLTDRRVGVTVTSNHVAVPGQRAAPVADLWKQCQSQSQTQSGEAVRTCTQIIDAKTETGLRLAHAHSLRGVALQGQGRFDDSIADFGAAIQLMRDAGKSDWELAFAHFMRAQTLRAKGDLEAAIADHTESIRIAPTWDKSYNDRGAIYFQKGDLPRALEDISKVISLRPDSPRVAESYAIRALLQLRMSEAAKAMPDADRAIALNARSAMAHYIRAKVHEALGRKDEAAAGLQAALAIDPGIEEQMRAMERFGKP